MYRITIVKDDPVIQEELSTLLQSSGYEVIVVTDFSNIAEVVKNDIPHLILLDINLPVQDGFKVCSKIRTFSNVPVIFVTSRNTDMDELNSIMLGGDDYISKPYNTSILLAWITSLLKRSYPCGQSETMTHKDVTLSLESSRAEFQRQSVELIKNELKIMAFLFRNAGKIVLRADLVEYLWDNQLYVDDNTLSVNIYTMLPPLSQSG
ncbi:MAG: response regulator transcription factor [Lachnospiraceae bacterium]